MLKIKNKKFNVLRLKRVIKLEEYSTKSHQIEQKIYVKTSLIVDRHAIKHVSTCIIFMMRKIPWSLTINIFFKIQNKVNWWWHLETWWLSTSIINFLFDYLNVATISWNTNTILLFNLAVWLSLWIIFATLCLKIRFGEYFFSKKMMFN